MRRDAAGQARGARLELASKAPRSLVLTNDPSTFR